MIVYQQMGPIPGLLMKGIGVQAAIAARNVGKDVLKNGAKAVVSYVKRADDRQIRWVRIIWITIAIMVAIIVALIFAR